MGAPARQLSGRQMTATALPSALPAPSRRRRSTPVRRRPVAPPKRRPTRRLVGRTAHAVTHLPESSAVVGMSRSRVWIAVIGVLLLGIIAINVLTVSYGSMASNLEGEIDALQSRNAILKSHETTALSMPRVRDAATAAGMTTPDPVDIQYRTYKPGDIAAAAQRLAAAGG
jgi:hypothetical protein